LACGEQDANPEALWQLVEIKHKVHSASEVEAVVKLAARTQLASTRQGAFESIIAFKQRYTNALKAYKDQKKPVMSPQDEAMDFFSKLDNARYAEFKTNYISSLQLKLYKPPVDLNKIFTLANTYLKPKVATGNGLGSTFATMADYISKKERMNRKCWGNQKEEIPGQEEEQEKNSDGSVNSPGWSKKQIKCFNCEGDHYVSNCPELIALKKAKEEGRITVVTWEGSTFCTYQVNVVGVERFGLTKVLLDNQADISIMKPNLLRMIEPAEKPIKVNGVGGVQLVVNETGYLQDFFRVYATANTKANVLCFADVEDLYEITYEQGTSFTVHLPDREIIFKRRNKLYVADFQEYYGNLLATKSYTKGEMHCTAQAYDFLKMSGYPSVQEAIHPVQDGHIANMPMLTAEDVRKAFSLFGEPVGRVRGKMTMRKIGRVVYDNDLVLDEKKQVLYTDVMRLDGHHFLVTVYEPLQLMLQCPVERENANALGIALQGQLELLQSRGFTPTCVHTDPQSSFRTLTASFENVVIDMSGAGDFVPKVDIKIRRTKEVYRGVKAELPWKLPPLMVKDLVAYAVSRINIWQTTAISQNVCPRVLFTGLRVDFTKELSLAFGDYCEVFDGSHNSSRSRPIP
jgi:hypothetical protein